MTKSFPYLAMDSAGKRTILCDYPIKMFDNTTKEKKAKMAHVMTNQEVQSRTKKLVARLLGQAGFAARFPGLSHVRIDNSGIAIPKRAASGGDAADFNARFPNLSHIRQG